MSEKLLEKSKGSYIPNYKYYHEIGDYIEEGYMCLNCRKTFNEENVSYCPHCGIKTKLYEVERESNE